MIICLDTETTGLDPVVSEILTLSVVDAETGDKVLDGMYRPSWTVSWPDAAVINGITPAMVARCPGIDVDAGRIRGVLEAADVVVVYNASFDLPFIEAAIGKLPPDMLVSDAMLDFARTRGVRDERRGDYKWAKLAEAAAHVGHDWTGAAHGSMADARAAAAVWRWLRARGEATTMPWGKFKIV